MKQSEILIGNEMEVDKNSSQGEGMSFEQDGS